MINTDSKNYHEIKAVVNAQLEELIAILNEYRDEAFESVDDLTTEDGLMDWGRRHGKLFAYNNALSTAKARIIK